MKLAVDIGNTSTVAGLVDSGSNSVLYHKRFATDSHRSAEQYNELLWDFSEKLESFGASGVDGHCTGGAIICSVVPDAVPGMVAPLEALSGNIVSVVSVDGIGHGLPGTHMIQPGMRLQVDNISEVGADRVVNGVAAYELFGGPVVIVDFGTALTLDYVDADGVYCGGIIAPGCGISLEALHLKTAKLPLVSLKKPGELPVSVVGKNTVESIRSGVYWGAVSMVDGLVEKIRGEKGFLKRVVATGGFASSVAGSTTSIDEVDEFLTLKGLGLIYERKG